VILTFVERSDSELPDLVARLKATCTEIAAARKAGKS